MASDNRDALPVSQEILLELVLPMIQAEGGHYKKYQSVHARPAVEGEFVVSVTADREETSNTAGAGDLVVKNLTEAKELYIVSQATFAGRYTEVGPIDDTWNLYNPVGEVRAIEISQGISNLLRVGKEFYLMASWGTEQVAREGDYFVTPLPQLGEVYRIARAEFEQTYALVQ